MVGINKSAVQAARKAIESTYDGVCSVIEHRKFLKADKSTGFREDTVLENLPCRLSVQSIGIAERSDTASAVNQLIKVFISPDIEIKAGSKMMITQNGVTAEYKASGAPALYSTHQEIILELFQGWA